MMTRRPSAVVRPRRAVSTGRLSACLVIAASGVLPLGGCAAGSDPEPTVSAPSETDSASESPTPTGDSSPTPSPTETGDDDLPPAGQKIVLQDWALTFQLPETIDVTEIQVLELDPNLMLIGSTALTDAYDRTKCEGITFEFGDFVEISRYDTRQDDDDVHIGDHFYGTQAGVSLDCYDDALEEKYFDDDVAETVLSTLRAG